MSPFPDAVFFPFMTLHVPGSWLGWKDSLGQGQGNDTHERPRGSSVCQLHFLPSGSPRKNVATPMMGRHLEGP